MYRAAETKRLMEKHQQEARAKAPITDKEKLEEVRREISLRRRFYPGWVVKQKLRQTEADRQIALMEAIERDYAAKVDAEKEKERLL